MRRTLLLGCLLACSGPVEPAMDVGVQDMGVQDLGTLDQGSSDMGVSVPDFLTVIDRLSELESLASLRNGGIKFLAPVDGAQVRSPIVEPCYFQNTARYEFHLQFLRSFEEFAHLSPQEYEDLVLGADTRIWWGGALRYYAQARHPDHEDRGALAYAVYGGNGPDALTEADLEAVDQRLQSCIPAAPERLAFLPTSPSQEAWARTNQAALSARGIAVVFMEDLR